MTRRFQILVLMMSLVATGELAHAQDDQVATLLKKYGIRPVSPPSAAVDFTLPDLGGSQSALSDHKGRWVLLTFFATWCGPCASEMPALESLHQTKRAAGFEVLGVAIEPGRDKIAAWTGSKGVTFQVLIDANSQAASIYRASSIPVSYLIDPAGRIVGVARGARNWTSVAGLIDDLVALIPPDEDATGQYATQQAPVQLPSNLVPPDATARLGGSPPRVGEPFEVLVDVEWAGNFEDYVLLPPQVHLPEGVTLEGTAATTSSQAGRAVITYVVTLRAASEGNYALDPIEVRYTPRFESQPVARRVSGPEVRVVSAGLGAVGLTGIAGAIIVLSLLAGVVVMRRNAASSVPAPAEESAHAPLAAALEAARKARVNGDIAACLEAVVMMQGQLNGEGPENLTDLVEKVRYGGYVPPSHELDQLLRQMERRVADLAPADANLRDDIKLREGS